MNAPLLPIMPRLPNRFTVTFDGFRKLRWKERFKILFGYNLTSHVRVMVDRRRASVKGECIVSLSEQRSQEGRIQQHIEDTESNK